MAVSRRESAIREILEGELLLRRKQGLVGGYGAASAG